MLQPEGVTRILLHLHLYKKTHMKGRSLSDPILFGAMSTIFGRAVLLAPESDVAAPPVITSFKEKENNPYINFVYVIHRLSVDLNSFPF